MPNKKIKQRASFLLLIFLIVFLPGFGLKCQDQAIQEAIKPITLKYWRVNYDGADAFAEIISQYRAMHPNITIEYRSLRYDEYEKELIEAFAVDRGPDIFSIHNTWTRKYQGKGMLTPLPTQTTMVYQELIGAIKKELTLTKRTTKSITLQEIKDKFVDAVYNDVVIKETDPQTGQVSEKIYGLPLAIDTLAMYYNKDLFNNAGITSPPAYWNEEFQRDVKKMTKQNSRGEIIQSGVALGGGKNIERSVDILAALMMQIGTVMIDDGGAVTFNAKPENVMTNIVPGLDALRFYTDFSNPAKEVYCWNSSLDNSLDAFIKNKVGILFGYTYMLPIIKARAPKLNFAIAKLPQAENNPQSVNFANYWVEVVAKKTPNQDAAWDFVQFMASQEQAKLYLAKTKKPTALRKLIDEELTDPEVGIFAGQVLTAKSWYKGANANAAELIMTEMIDDAASGKSTLDIAINTAAQKVQQTIRQQ